MVTVGLFGTCSGSRWRETYKAKLAAMRLDFFDPQIMPKTHGREWCEADIDNELRHLDSDEILLFKVTSEAASHVTMLEILRVIRRPTQFVIVVIEDEAVLGHQITFDGDLSGKSMMPTNPLRDAQVARQWTRKQVLESGNPLVSLAQDDEHALALIKTCCDFLAAKEKSMAVAGFDEETT